MAKVYFTFCTNNYAGIGDQLGAQFAHVYALGQHCGWTYVRLAPFRFDRMFSLNRFTLTGGNGSLDAVANYLGLDTTDEEPLVHHKIEIDISHLINDSPSVLEMNDRIHHVINLREKNIHPAEKEDISVLVEIKLGNEYGLHLSAIQERTSMDWDKTIQFAGSSYLQNQLTAQALGFDSEQPFAVAHIRFGDSIKIDTPYCPVILHGHQLYTNLSRFQAEIGAIDKRRVPFMNPNHLLNRVNSLIQAKGYDRDSLYIVSDGFKTTKACIWGHIRKRRLDLRTGFSALREAYRLERMFYNSIKLIPLSRRIIGEDPDKTLGSIKLFSRASFLMCNSGGFSSTIFNLYNPLAKEDGHFEWL